MDFTPETKLKDILAAYPWLAEELPKIDSRLGVINTPLGRLLLKKADVAEAAKRSGFPAEQIIEKLRELIAEHGRSSRD